MTTECPANPEGTAHHWVLDHLDFGVCRYCLDEHDYHVPVKQLQWGGSAGRVRMTAEQKAAAKLDAADQIDRSKQAGAIAYNNQVLKS